METSQRQVARAAALVMAAFAVSRLLGLVRQVVFGAYYGTGPEMDAYVAAVSIPDAIFLVVAGGALGSAFIPLFTGRLARGEAGSAWRLGSAVVTLLVLLVAPVSLFCILFAPWLVDVVVAPALPPDVQARTVDLMRVMLLSPTIFGVSGVVMGALNAHQHFLLPAIAPIVYNVGLIAGALWGGLTPVGAMGASIGMVAGAAGHLLVQVPGLRRYGAWFHPTLGRGDAGVREVGRLILPRMLGMAAAQINIIVTRNLASRLGLGAISTLEYAWRIMLLPQGIFAQAVGTAVFPTFSQQAALGQVDALRKTLINALRTLMALTVPASVGMVLLGEPLVTLLFERGAFQAESTRAVAWALGFFAVGLVGHSALEILGRAFYALQDTWTPAGAATVSVVLNGLLGLTLPRYFGQLGLLPLGGLALATALAALVEMSILLVLIRARLGALRGRELIVTALRVILASAGMGAVLWALREIGPRSALLQAAVGVPVGALVYGLLAWLMGVEQLRSAVRTVFSRAEG
ncbi:MAG: murein biosynthesis integral membrane protein MurJ [Anaerolineae bacterium]|nr:murein biosynthesis integral membrane protein MurJ [Anaerolineae bacterium]